MRVIATKVKETKNMVRFEANANGVIVTVYVNKGTPEGDAPTLAIEMVPVRTTTGVGA
jgi:hypothetical protein